MKLRPHLPLACKWDVWVGKSPSSIREAGGWSWPWIFKRRILVFYPEIFRKCLKNAYKAKGSDPNEHLAWGMEGLSSAFHHKAHIIKHRCVSSEALIGVSTRESSKGVDSIHFSFFFFIRESWIFLRDDWTFPNALSVPARPRPLANAHTHTHSHTQTTTTAARRLQHQF